MTYRVGFFCKKCEDQFECDWTFGADVTCAHCGTVWETDWDTNSDDDISGPWLTTPREAQHHPNYDIVGRFGYRTPFWATVNGIRSRFEMREHMNIGKAWMCAELDGRLPPGIYTESRMTDISETQSDAEALSPHETTLSPEPRQSVTYPDLSSSGCHVVPRTALPWPAAPTCSLRPVISGRK